MKVALDICVAYDIELAAKYVHLIDTVLTIHQTSILVMTTVAIVLEHLPGRQRHFQHAKTAVKRQNTSAAKTGTVLDACNTQHRCAKLLRARQKSLLDLLLVHAELLKWIQDFNPCAREP